MGKKRARTFKRRRYDDKHLKKIFPHWLPLLYGGICLFLIPWTTVLAFVLPPKYVSHHWDVAWTGFDSLLLLIFAATAYLAVKKSSWTAISATILGTLLLVDAWFDSLTSKAGHDIHLAALGAVFEIVLALTSYTLAFRIFNDVRHRRLVP